MKATYEGVCAECGECHESSEVELVIDEGRGGIFLKRITGSEEIHAIILPPTKDYVNVRENLAVTMMAKFEDRKWRMVFGFEAAKTTDHPRTWAVRRRVDELPKHHGGNHYGAVVALSEKDRG